jgi:hypothetical protein
VSYHKANKKEGKVKKSYITIKRSETENLHRINFPFFSEYYSHKSFEHCLEKIKGNGYKKALKGVSYPGYNFLCPGLKYV